ncbi:MAG TPA: TonB-dependent receptor [Balneolaceae bacterium]
MCHIKSKIIVLASIIFFLLGLQSLSFAQSGKIEGTVIEQKTGDAIPGINIIVKGTGLGTATNSNGAFSLSEIPAGSQILVISGIGYKKQEKTIQVHEGKVTTLEIRLASNVVELNEIKVVDQRNTFEETYSRTKTVAYVSSEKTKAYNSTNAYDALRIVPGVSYLNGSGNRFGKPSRIRGASSWTIANVIEEFPSVREAGIGAEDGGLKSGFGSSIPSIALRSIKVVKGSQGVLYSGNANGGVIVNSLKQGDPGDRQATLWLEANPINELLVMGDISGGGEYFDYYLAGKWLNGNYTQFKDSFGRKLNTDRFFSGLAKIGYRPAENIRLEFIGLSGQDKINYTIPRDDNPDTQMDESSELPPDRFRTTSNTNFYGLSFKHDVSENISYEGGYSLFLTKAYRYSMTEGAAHRDRPQRSNTWFANTYLKYELSETIDYAAKIGAELMTHHQEENANSSSKAHHFIDRSIFYANSISFADRLYLSGGIRFLDAEDDFKHQQGFYYDAGVSYRVPVINTQIKSSYSTSYSRNKGFIFFFEPIEEAGGAKLSENISYEIGLEQPIVFPGQSGTVHLKLTAFRNINKGVPIFSGWGAGVVYYEDYETEGIEASLNYRLPGIGSVFGSFTYMDPIVTSTTHPEGVGVGSTSVPVPQYSGSLGLRIYPLDKLTISAIGTYSDGMRRRNVNLQTGEVTTTTNASYTRINLTGQYEFSDRVTIMIRVENLLNQKDLGYSSITYSPAGVQQANSVATDPGRFVSLAVILNF